MSSELMDFGQGAASGATAGSYFGPWGAAIGGVAGGAISLFGGAEQRGLERKNNQMYFQQQAQGMQLNRLQLSQAMRENRAAKESERKKKVFNQMLGQWFKDNYAKQSTPAMGGI